MIKPLTSLRFIFAFMVFLSHYVVEGTALFSEGYIGVSFFFILSGFVLTYSYKDRLLSGTTTKTEFFVARIARIYPLHFITFTAYLGIAFLAANAVQWDMVLANITLTQSWIPIEKYYFSFNAPSWSISDEMFFYIMFPLLILFIYRSKSKLRQIVSISLLSMFAVFTVFLIHYYPGKLHAFIYINPLFRILDFVIGIGIYQLWQYTRNDKKLVNMLSNIWRATALEVLSIAVLIVMIVFSYDLPQAVRYSCYYWLPMTLVICVFATTSNSKGGGGYLSRLLSMKFAVVLGEISFGFYMIHTFVLFMSEYLIAKFGIILPVMIQFVLISTLVLVGSIISFYWFETPMNRWIKQLYKNRQNTKYIGN